MKFHLKNLEQKSIYVLREAKNRFRNIAILWLAEKASTTCLYLCKRAFFGKIPFTVIFVDSGHDSQETYQFRDEMAKKWEINLSIFPVQSDVMKMPEALNRIQDNYRVDSLIISMTRDDNLEWFEKRFSPASRHVIKHGDVSCVCPLMFWTELDIWQYIGGEQIPVNPLYFARDGKRYENMRYPGLAVSIKSKANTVTEIIDELQSNVDSKRNDTTEHEEEEIIMQRLRDLGYL